MLINSTLLWLVLIKCTLVLGLRLRADQSLARQEVEVLQEVNAALRNGFVLNVLPDVLELGMGHELD